jgi:pimeloyl-ACP methyl ester carboxylesterase
VLPERKIPEVFWYQRGLRYTLSAQPGEAPLVILIPGTGAGPTARLVDVLARIFYAGGYHVLAVPSPTFSNFVVTASSTGVPGRVDRDARDLHQALRLVYDEVAGRIPIKDDDVSLVGYSLGGWHAAFVGWIDENEAEKPLGFRRVLLINPPVNLYTSSRILDDYIDKIPGGISGLPAFFNEVFKSLSSLYTSAASPSDLTGDFLYQSYVALKPSREVLAALIGVVFRLASTDLTFTADVMGDVGTLVRPGRPLDASTSLTPYLVTGLHHGFTEYLSNLLYPFYQRTEPTLTIEQLVEEADLRRLGGYLAANPKYRLITNEDEIINSKAEIDFLRQTFAGRGVIFPRGGHCGNFQYPPVVAAMLQALAEDAP